MLFRSEKRMVDGMKIGQYVQYQMRKIYEGNLLTEGELQNLQDKEYSKFVFDQNLIYTYKPPNDYI